MEDARGRKKEVVRFRSDIERWREGVYSEVEERAHCSLLYFR